MKIHSNSLIQQAYIAHINYEQFWGHRKREHIFRYTNVAVVTKIKFLNSCNGHFFAYIATEPVSCNCTKTNVVPICF